MKTAYLVGALNQKTHKLEGVAIFSEPGPTISQYPVVFAEVSKPSYVEARDAVEALLKHPAFSWLEPLYQKRGSIEGTSLLGKRAPS